MTPSSCKFFRWTICYVLENLVTGTKKEYNITQIYPLHYDDEIPRQIASRDFQQWDIEEKIDYAGSPSHRKEMKFRVRWAGYDESCDTLEPWKHVNYNDKLHEYLRAKKMAKFIPKYKQNEYTGVMRNK